MDRVLANYQTRLNSWRLEDFKGEFPSEFLGDLNQKFYPSGVAKSFYGLTVVAFIDPESALHQRLCDFQNRHRTALELAGLDSIFSFLNPLSFHMTLCDIVAAPNPPPLQLVERVISSAREAFPQLGLYPKLSCQLTGLGADASLLMLAQFETAADLECCLDLEKCLKAGLGVDERSFLGHVSLAYFVQAPREDLKHIKRTLDPFSRESLGLFPITKIDLCYFRDMNSYIPLMSFDLRDGSFSDYSSTLEIATLQ
ncbi:MAG: DUF1868 domain-containing protein [Candidatus Marinimicrobia bacterium]|nr:DUF1868 domain-containing protein [Candidatus Neomarinimicrobiota bacterium]